MDMKRIWFSMFLLMLVACKPVGWLVEPSEWWHFNAMPIADARQKLTVIQ